MEKNINNRRMVLLLLFYSCKQAGCTWVQPTVQSYNVVQSQLAEHNQPGAWWAAQTDLVSAGECLNPNPPSKVKTAGEFCPNQARAARRNTKTVSLLLFFCRF